MPFHRGTVASGSFSTPSAPTSFSASSAANAQSVLAWVASTENGGSAITDYIVQYSADNSNWTTFSDGVSSSSTGTTVTGLTNGTLYYFRVGAINIYGTSSYATTSATPYTTPSAPATATLTAGTGATTTDTFTWVAPSTNGSAITTYGYQVSTDNGSSWGAEVVSNVLTYGINTAYTTTRYSLRVRAYNSAGWSAYSTNSAQTAVWAPNAGTATDPDYVCGPDGCSGTDTTTENWTDACAANCYQGQYCNCGAQYRYRTRSRTTSKTRTSYRERTAPTNYYSRAGNDNSATTTGTYGGWSAYTYGSWSYGTPSEWTYSGYGEWSACDSTGTWTSIFSFSDTFAVSGGTYSYVTGTLWGWGYSDAAGNLIYNPSCGGLASPGDVESCNRVTAYRVVGTDTCIYPSA